MALPVILVKLEKWQIIPLPLETFQMSVHEVQDSEESCASSVKVDQLLMVI